MDVLAAEAEEHGDIVVLPVRDIYEEIALKNILIWKHLLESSEDELCVVHDDEWRLADGWEGMLPAGDWFGVKLTSESKSHFHNDRDGGFAPYLAGWCQVIRRAALAEIFSRVGLNEMSLTGRHLVMSSDMHMGRWMKRVGVKPVVVPGMAVCHNEEAHCDADNS